MLAAFGVCVRVALGGLAAGLAGVASAYAGTGCEQLTGVRLADASVVSSAVMEAGAFRPPDFKPDAPGTDVYKKTPVFCRSIVKAAPSGDSDIEIEVWLPVEGWNHKFLGVGNGGFAGSIDYREMASSLSSGYATAGTDAGHKGEGTDASWALGHPEKVIDFGYRAVHEMTGVGRALSERFYGEPVKRAYFDACSNGGREALMEAQRFPQDYDGILAGAPANDWTHLLTAALDVLQISTASPATFIPPETLPVITDAVLRACDANDGIKDGILNDPTHCRFDPSVLRCKADGKSNGCLSEQQVTVLKKIYRGTMTPNGAQIFPGLMPSSEAGENGWKDWVMGPTPGKALSNAFGEGFFRNMAYEKAEWTYRGVDVGIALETANRKLASVLNATDPDLSKFKARGGKLILYHGWLDPAIPPLNTIRYYQSVAARMGQEKTGEFVRLYMVPGMQHCAGGPGPHIFGQLRIAQSRDSAQNVFTALERWVEQGDRPGAIIATKLKDDRDASKGVLMTRPLCPYPEFAKYRGSGNANEASAFTCAAPKAVEVSAKPEVLH